MNTYKTLALLSFLSASFIPLAVQPAHAKSYTFQFVLDELTETLADHGDLINDDDDIFEKVVTPGPLVVGSGSVSFIDDRASQRTSPFEFSTAGFGFTGLSHTDIRSPIRFNFSGGSDEAELVGISFFAVDPLMRGVRLLEAEGSRFSIYYGEILGRPDGPNVSSSGSGFIQFQQVESNQLEVVPEPLTILGSIAAIGIGGVIKRKVSK